MPKYDCEVKNYTKKSRKHHPKTVKNEAQTYPKSLQNRCRNWAPEKVGKNDVRDSFRIIDFGTKSDQNPPSCDCFLIFGRRFADFDFSMDFSLIFDGFGLHFKLICWRLFDDSSIDFSSMFLDHVFNEKTHFLEFVIFIKSHSRRGKTYDFT